MEQNQLRVLVKTDPETIQTIAKDTGIHYNTITRLIRPGVLVPVDPRTMECIQKLAARYNMVAKINVEFEPIEAAPPQSTGAA